MPLSKILVPILGLLLAACGNSSGGAPSSSAATSAAAPLCATAEALRTRLAPIDVDQPRISVQHGITLPEAKEGARVPDGAQVVSFDGTAFWFDGQKASGPDDAASRALERRAMFDQTGMRASRAFVVALHRDAKDLTPLASLVRAFPAGTELWFVAQPPGAHVEPVPKALEKAVLEGSSSERATAFAGELTRAIAKCPQVKSLFQRMGAEPPEGKAASLKQKLPVELAACNCAVDADFNDIVTFLLASDRPVVGKLVVTSRGAGTTEIDLAGKTPDALWKALPDARAEVSFKP